MNRIALLLLAFACLGLGGWAFWERTERLKLVDQVASLEKQAPAGPAQAPGRRRAAAGQDDPSDPAGGKPADDAKPKKDKSEAGNAFGESMAKMMSDPKMRDAMKSQARMGIGMMYRDLFDLLNLEEPKRSQLENLVMEKASIGMEIGFSMMSGDKTPEEMKAAGEELKTKTEEMNGKIKDLLGAEDFEKVDRYEKSTPERTQLATFNGMLAGKNLKMDEATESKLMDVMYQEREKFPFASNYADQQNTDLTRFSDDNLTRFNDEYAELNKRIAGRASTLLPEEQLELFKQSQEQQMNMTKMGMEMATKMFGGAAKKD